MDPRTNEINNLCLLNDFLAQTIVELSRAQRFNVTGPQGLMHTPFGQNVFGTPVQGMPVDPRRVDYTGLTHSPYGNYPYYYGQTPWMNEIGRFPTHIDPFVDRRGLSHTNAQWTGWSPYAAAEYARQRELQQIIARQQYESMWRPF